MKLKCRGNGSSSNGVPCVHNPLVPVGTVRARGGGQAARWQPHFIAELNFCSFPAVFISSLTQTERKMRDKLNCNDEFSESQRKLCLSSSCIWATLFLIGSLSKMPQVQAGITAVQHKVA